MRKYLRGLASATIMATMILSSVSAYATELPQSIMMDGREFVMDVSAGGGSDSAEPDKSMNLKRSLSKSSYTVKGSDVRLYVDYSHGHGGDHFSAGWVRATAPSFTARAEVWSGSRLDTTGSNYRNAGDTAEATSYLAVGIVKNAKPRIFYSW